MKNLLLVFTENFFTQNDLKRFGIEKLLKRYDVCICDFTNYLHPSYYKTYSKKISYFKNRNINLKKILSLEEFTSFLEKQETGMKIFVLDNLSIESLSSYKCFLKKKFEKLFFIKVHNNQQPKTILYFKIKYLLFSRNFFWYFKKILNKIFSFPFTKKNIVTFEHDFILKSHTFNDETSKIKTFYIHSTDYEKIFYESFDYEKKQKFDLPKYKYAVYVEEMTSSHPDFEILSRPVPISKEKYLQEINNFFFYFEKYTNLKIVISMHPRNLSLNSEGENFNRPKFYGEIYDLIKNSSLVLTHQSTSVNIAVTYKKPIIFLDSSSYKDLRPRIHTLRQKLGGKIFNINKKKFYHRNFENLFSYDQNKYKNYFSKYIKHPKSNDRSIFDIILDLPEDVK